MAVSAFKSSSRRGNYTNSTISSSSSTASGTSRRGVDGIDNVDKKVYRRSRSVSATSRLQNSGSFDDVVNKRDNPLFNSSPPDDTKTKSLSGVNSGRSTLDKPPSKVADNGVGDGRRGRSVSRSSDSRNGPVQSRKTMGQSLSRLDTVRRNRSVSRVRREDSESDVEIKYSLSSPSRSKVTGNSSPGVRKSVNVATSDLDKSSSTRNPHKWSSRHSVSEPLDNFCDDTTSTSSFSEAEEKTILAFTEQIESFQSDLPEGDVRNGGLYETVRSEVRRAINEIQGDLENSQERARKLRADLVVEEHREQEFSKILEEIVPEPRTLQTEESRPRRKNSIERRRMSRRLTEEALNYFDECVSISTFDGSDFSAEDPLSHVALSDPTIDDQTDSSASASYYCRSPMNNDKQSEQKYQSMLSEVGSGLLASSDSKPIDSTASLGRKFRFSLTREPAEAPAIGHEIGNFGKMFEKDTKGKDKDHVAAGSSYYDGYYHQAFPDERVLSERVVLRNLIESGSFLLCDIWT